MSVVVRNLQRAVPVRTRALERQVAALRDGLPGAACARHAVGVTLAGAARMCALNAHYRGRARPTDVLAFRAADPPPADTAIPGLACAPRPPGPDAICLDDDDDGGGGAREMPLDLGDIFVCPQICRTYAARFGWSVHDYLPLVLAHGVAHLAGYTHDAPDEYDKMKQAEEEALEHLFRLENRPTAIEGKLAERERLPLPFSYLR